MLRFLRRPRRKGDLRPQAAESAGKSLRGIGWAKKARDINTWLEMLTAIEQIELFETGRSKLG